MKPIIGLDFGNYNTFPCFIQDFDIGTRMGGNVYDLLPASPEMKDGIPSVYFYSQRAGVLIGENAVRSRAVPLSNRLQYLKRHLNEATTLDGKRIEYNDAITQVIQHAVRSANEELQREFHLGTNLISLAYPAVYGPSEVNLLIDLAENATLEDGTSVKVYGTIAEPAAAALDYLADFAKSEEETTVLTYDLGGGTFDLALVSAYPKGKKRETGEMCYYNVIDRDGLRELGGKDFDEVMYKLLSGKVKKSLNKREEEKLKAEAEMVKIRLSKRDTMEDTVYLESGADYVEIPITRKEFEEASRNLMSKTIEKTREFLNHQSQKPEIILLTGGASQMPTVKETLEKEFPKYRGKIIAHRPSRAIAYGAARFGTTERNEELAAGDEDSYGSIALRISRDIGIGFIRLNAATHTDIDYVATYVKAGTELPFVGEYETSYTRYENQMTSSFLVYEAIKPNPSSEKKEDWNEIMRVQLRREGRIPKGTKSETRIKIDKSARIHIDARDVLNPSNIISNEVQLKWKY